MWLRLVGEFSVLWRRNTVGPTVTHGNTPCFVKLDPASLHHLHGVYLFSGLFKFKVTEKSGSCTCNTLSLVKSLRNFFRIGDPLFTDGTPFVIEFQKEADGSVKRAKAWQRPGRLGR